ncbi:MAG: outer membrane protein assembly factor BamA [Bryobacterales bacterium]|nr:outer membrane protein assembly factor BamA [Bryobacterales bacterium]
MVFCRLKGLSAVVVCVCAILPLILRAQQPSAQPPRPDQAKTPAPAKKQSPFESVPQAPSEQPPPAAEPKKPETQRPGRPALEAPQEAQAPPPAQNVVDRVEFRGARRVPQDTLRAMIATRRGDVYNEEVLRRDFMALWNTGRFDDIRLESEPGPGGVVVRFMLTERRVVRSIKYEGMKSITVSEILDRFKERKVGLSVESQFDPNKVQRATVVLKEYLAERGRQFAEVEPDVRQIPPSSLEITFNVKEGPKVKIGDIDVVGNQVFNDRRAIRAMKSIRPIGVPHSIFLENIFSKTFDSTKLDMDKDLLRDAYQQEGYFTARVLDHKMVIRDVGGGKFRIPLFYRNKPGKRADLTIPVEEGRQYKLNKINFVGVKLFRTPETLMKPLFQMQEGDIFSTAKLRKGLENLRKLYGEFGYIDFVPEPDFNIIPNSDKIDLTLTADEGKQFFIRRIDFAGNQTTRDKVIRREILLDEGDMYNTRLWELSILRLNQLGYFEVLKEEEAADIKRNPGTNTVDITLKVKERGKNTVGLTGGVSGIAGSFVGFNYSTNNFLGLGETLSIESQLGDRLQDVSFGFTEPYFMDRPLQLGFVVYTRRFNYDQGREVSLLTGRNLIPLFEAVGRDNLMNYVQNGYGFTVSASYPLKRSFARVGITYGYDNSDITVNSTASRQYFEFINFQGLGGPNSLTGIKTSAITPSYSYNTVNHPINPTAGRSLFISTQFAGSFLGGNVNTIRPVVDAKWFKPSPFNNKHILAFHGMASLLTGYGGKVAPPFARTYIGGEQDIRGFDIWGISPMAFIPSEATINVLNADGSARTQKNADGEIVNQTMRIPIYQLIFPGGDTQFIGNFEYRIPIVGPVTLAAFMDAGVNKILRSNQLTMNSDRVSELNGIFPQANFTGKAIIAPGTQKVRMSTGLELQVLLPVVNAPFRIYWAYNPLVVRQFLQPPIVADRSMFPNQATFINSVATWGNATPFFEQRRTFRFTIGRTF